MSLGHAFLIHLRAAEARKEIAALAEHARRCLGQSIRRAREKLAKQREIGK